MSPPARQIDASGEEPKFKDALVGSQSLANRLKRLGPSFQNVLLALLPLPGDFVIFGNLETLRSDDHWAIGQWLAQIKDQRGAGKSARSRRGHHGCKRVMGEWT